VWWSDQWLSLAKESGNGVKRFLADLLDGVILFPNSVF
jgi:hypothetical protein